MREAAVLFALLSSEPAALLSVVAVGAACAWLGFSSLRRGTGRHLSLASPGEANCELKEAEEARSRAEAASEAKSRLLATMSHEIRTPLNGILGMAELLVSTGLDLEQQSYVEAMRTSGLALSALIEEILDFSKIQAGKFELAQAPFDLISLVEGVIELLAPQAQGKDLEIASSIAPGLATRVVGDAVRLRQVLINLVGNAVKYTATGGVGLRVSSLGDALEFAVIDTGPGIAAPHRDVIFEEFSVASNEMQPSSGSTGLGLSISRRLVEQMRGSLRLSATSDAGSTFVLRLPLPPAQGSAPLPMPATLLGKRALIVATSHFEAPYLAEMLSAAGVELLWAGGEEASQIFLRETGRAGRAPDIVIVDCALGTAATRALGDAARAAGVGQSFVFFSPFERRAFGQNSLQTFDGWLVKPLRVRSLYARLEASTPHPTGRPAPVIDADTKLQGLDILLAEDNDINALIVIRHFEKRGAKVLRVSDGLSALQAANDAINGNRPLFDAAILDIRMPGLDGIEVARRIRLAEHAAGAAPCRLIALSADAFDAAVEAARAAGIDEFLVKPVDLARLERLLATCAGKPDREPMSKTALPA
jgi:signal transduction histidine kinase/CheY-like chemotaxis protein